MKIMENSVAKLGLACAFCAFFGSSALALDTDEVLSRLETTLAASGITSGGGTVTTEGNNIIVENFSIEAASIDDAKNLTLRLNDIAENGNGSFTIGRLSVDDSSLKIAGDQMDFTGFEIGQLYLPSESESHYDNSYQSYQSIGVKSLTFYDKGKPVVNVDNSYARVSDFEVGKRIALQGAIEKISFSVEDIDGEPAAGLQEMGYETISGKVEFSSKLDFDARIMDFENVALILDNIGTLSLSLQFGGLTPEVAEAVAEIQAMEDEQAAGMAMLGIGAQLTFNSFSIRFDDNSITNKALDYAAKNTGAPRTDVIAMATATAQFGLANLQHAEFADKVSQALGSYLNAPGSLELAAKPANPMNFLGIFGAAQDPKSLIDMLNVEVSANK